MRKLPSSGAMLTAPRRVARDAAYATGLPKVINRSRLESAGDICFIWIPKAAGTSIYSWLRSEVGMLKLKNPIAVRGGFPQCGPVTFGHLDYSELLRRGWVDREFDKRAFKFAFVRNPYDRAISLYVYLARGRHVSGSFKDFLRTVAHGVHRVGLYNRRGLSQCNPQVHWLIGPDGQWLVDRLFRTERFDSEVGALGREIGARPVILHENVSKRPGWVASAYGDDESVALVREIYREDFAALGYSEDPHARSSRNPEG